jgi:hypothetical protein
MLMAKPHPRPNKAPHPKCIGVPGAVTSAPTPYKPMTKSGAQEPRSWTHFRIAIIQSISGRYAIAKTPAVTTHVKATTMAHRRRRAKWQDPAAGSGAATRCSPSISSGTTIAGTIGVASACRAGNPPPPAAKRRAVWITRAFLGSRCAC